MKKFIAGYCALVVLLLVTLVQASPQIQPLDMQGYKINRLGSGTVATDAANIGQTINSVTTSGTGLIAQTAASTWATRTLTAPAAGITVSNGDGVAGNPTLALANDLAALEGMASTGLVARTASETYSQRTITATTDVTSITNGDGVSGNPTVDLAARYKAGWTQATGWSYASATSITVPSDATTTYNVGDRIHLVQSATDKYFYIVAVAATTLTIDPNTDYTLTNSAITSPEYSKQQLPVSFPDWFNYSPTLTGFSANPTNAIYKFKIDGRKVTVVVAQTTNGTSSTTGFTITAPVTARTVSNGSWGAATTIIVDNTALPTTPGLVWIQSASNSMVLYLNQSLAGWTASGGKRAYFTLVYEI